MEASISDETGLHYRRCISIRWNRYANEGGVTPSDGVSLVGFVSGSSDRGKGGRQRIFFLNRIGSRCFRLFFFVIFLSISRVSSRSIVCRTSRVSPTCVAHPAFKRDGSFFFVFPNCALTCPNESL